MICASAQIMRPWLLQKAGVKPAVSCSSKNRRAAVSCKYRHF